MAAGKVQSVTQKANETRPSKTKASAKGKPSFLSDEHIIDSDSDNDTNTNEVVQAKPTTVKIPAAKSNGISSSAKSAVSTTKRAGEDTSSEDTSDNVSESEEDSSSEGESEEKRSTTAREPSAQTAKTNGLKRKTSSQDETATKSSNDSDGEQQRSKKARVTHDGSSSSSDEDESAEASSSRQVVAKTAARPQASKAPQLSSLAPIPSQAYVAPHGYRALKTTGSTVISWNELAGKQIWHITAPAGVPISSIKAFTLDAISSGEPILTHDNTPYVLIDSVVPEASILLPDQEGYKPISQPIAKSLNLRPAFTLPTIPARAAARDAGSLAAGNIATAAVTTIRPQPKGLKMRYRPPGYGKGNPGVIGVDSDEEEEEGQAKSTFQFPRTVGPSTDGDGARFGEGTVKSKKDKKQKRLSHAPNGVAEHAEPQAMAPTEVPAALNKVAAKLGMTDNDEARRKAEKKAKKAAKHRALAEA